MSTTTALKTRPLRADLSFGCEVLDVDFAAADAETRQALVGAFHVAGAILLRGQSLTPDDLIAFVSLFGPPAGHTLAQYTLPGYPEIYVLSNKKAADGTPIGAHNDGVGWHTDLSYKAEPSMSTMLYAVEVPPVGSDTLIADMCAAYQALPEDRKAALEGLRLHHSYAHFMATRAFGREALSDEIKAANPDVIHPLIRTHPADGRKALWPSTGTVVEIVGADDPADMTLLDELIAFGTQDRFVYRHQWQVGDLLMWDNRCTLHTGTLYDDKTYDRLMHRAWVQGDRPY